MSIDQKPLSPSLEDYLEAIYNLQVRSKTARVKDIARTMDVKMPSVTGALRSLADRKLVKHDPYGSVELTESGIEYARGIAHRHSAVKEFLVSILGLAEDKAEEEACGIEHAIKPETLQRLLRFVDFARDCGDQPVSLTGFRKSMQGNSPAQDSKGPGWRCVGPRGRGGRWGFSKTISSTKLSDLCPGVKGRIAFVSGRGPIRRRLLEMGLTPDTTVEVIRAAPFGDPIEIRARGYCLSLRRSEAEHVEVEME